MPSINKTVTAAALDFLTKTIEDNTTILTGLTSLTYTAPNLILDFVATLPAAEDTELDTLLSDHPLEELKNRRYKELDNRTDELIKKGFTYDGVVFSMSDHAQITMMAIKELKDVYSYPKKISNKGNGEYSMTNAQAVQDFFEAGDNHRFSHLDSGRAYKISIKNAVDIPAVDAIIDTR